jgi:transposase
MSLIALRRRCFHLESCHGDGNAKAPSTASGALVSRGSGRSFGHPFYLRLNELLERAGFDEFCEAPCRKFYHEKLGRPSLAPGTYFRLLLIGFFEGIESERGIAWRVTDSLCLREFLQIGLDERTPDHVTISRTRRLMDEATHQEVFGWVL